MAEGRVSEGPSQEVDSAACYSSKHRSFPFFPTAAFYPRGEVKRSYCPPASPSGMRPPPCFRGPHFSGTHVSSSSLPQPLPFRQKVSDEPQFSPEYTLGSCPSAHTGDVPRHSRGRLLLVAGPPSLAAVEPAPGQLQEGGLSGYPGPEPGTGLLRRFSWAQQGSAQVTSPQPPFPRVQTPAQTCPTLSSF